MDVVGYSKLTEAQLQAFVLNVLPKLADILVPHRAEFFELNTWGDAIIVVCSDQHRLARIGLELRDYFRTANFGQFGLPDNLKCRIALHAGKIMTGIDPLRKRKGVVGTQVNLAARIEPVTKAGEVFATDAFERMANSGHDPKICYDGLGERSLAKQFGSRNLFRVRWDSDANSQPQDDTRGGEPKDDYPSSSSGSSPKVYDVIGIGALNLDFIATKSRLRRIEPDLIAEVARRFELGTERLVEKPVIDQTLSRMGMNAFEPCLGGSSFNVIHALACADRELSLGFIGVAGSTGLSEIDFERKLRELSINSEFLRTTAEPSGICISYIHDGERSLLTWPGANVEMSNLLKERRDEIISFLSRAKLIHLTSFFDDTTAWELAAIIRNVKRQNPNVRISFDPGHHWIDLARKTDPILELLHLSDFLFLNNREFEMLGQHRPGTPDIVVAREIFAFCRQQSLLVVLKRYDQIKIFQKYHGDIKCCERCNEVLSFDEIEDATGAGDVFAAGLLLSRLIPLMDLPGGVDLGLELVHSKLKTPGSSGFTTFKSTVEEFIDRSFRSRSSCEILSFDYADSPCSHGWRIEAQPDAKPSFTHRRDINFGNVLEIKSTANYAMDIDVKPLAQICSILEFVAKVEIGYAIYAKVRLRNQAGERTWGWLKTQIGSGSPEPLGEREWTIYVAPESAGGGWSLFRLTLADSVGQTFARAGWRYEKLLGLRIRGDVSLAEFRFVR